MNIGLLALSQRHGAAAHPALSLEDHRTVTYGELRELRDSYARGLVHAGVVPGDRVGILLHNSIEYWAAYLAVTRIGAICVRLNFRLSASELDYVLGDAGCSTLLLHSGLAAQLAPIIDRSPVRRAFALSDSDVPSWAAPEAELLAAQGPLPGPTTDADTPAMIMYTSGTTGRPKGAVWTHGSTVWFGLMQILQWGYHSGTVSMTTGPLYHVGSMEDLLLPTLMAGGHGVITRSGSFSLPRALGVMQARGVTDTLLFPAMLYEMLSDRLPERFDLSKLRRIVTGGSPLQPRAVRELSVALPDVELYPVYGLTEGGGISTVLEPAEVAAHPDAAGRPMPLAAVRIERLDGVAAGPEEVGEILVRGPNAASGYWNRPEESAETFVAGWWRTGDLGRHTEDGLLYVTGRKKDMIRSGDENVYAAEVENAISELPEVHEAAVIGVPDPRFGEAVCAVVVLRPGMTLTAEQVAEHCRRLLAGYKKPRHVVFADDLPRNATNKVLKHVLRDRYAALGDS